MSDLPSVLDRLLGTAAWTFAWQSTLWLVLGLLASRFLRRHAAQAHLLLVSATAAALLSPSLTLTVRHFECGLLPARQSVPNGFPATPTTRVEPSLVQPSEFPGQRKIVALSELASLAPVSSNLNSSSSYPSKSVPALDSHPLSASFKILVPAAFATCWLLASLVLTVRLMISLGAGHRIARDSRFETSPVLLTALSESVRALGVRTAPALRVSDSAQCPMIWCWGAQPALFVPRSAGETRGVDWQSVFCHELAHLIRRDHWSALWTQILVIAVPWQPLAWLSRRRLAFLQEQACDDWVLACGGEPTEYAESLVNLVPQKALAFALPALRNGEPLQRRLAHVLSGLRARPRVEKRSVAVACVMLLAATAGLALAQEGTAAAPGKVEAGAAASATDDSQNFSGLVIDQNGQPVAGAHLAAIAWQKAPARGGDLADRYELLCETAADREGRFQVHISGASAKTHEQPLLMARADGFALAVAPFNLGGNQAPLTLHLPKEHVLHARLVDLQGQPAAGVEAPVVQLSAKIPEWTPQYAWHPAGLKFPAAWPRATISNAQGRIEIHGLADGTNANLEVAPSERFARQFLMLRAGVSAKNPPSIGKDQPGTKGTADASHETVLPLAPARMIEGVVRYADTKQPVPHARLTAYAGPQQFGPFLGLSEKADAEGRFRIHPFSGVYLRLTAYPPADAPYLIREKTFEWKTGTATAHIDVVLPRGILVRGRVVETATGNPIPHASIEFLPDNKTRAKAGDEVITGWQAIEQSDANGGYAIAVPPGSGHLLVYGPTGEYVSHAMGRREVDGLGLGGRRMYAHANVPVKAASAAAPIDVKISIEKGATISGRLVTPDGVAPDAALLVSRLINISPLSPEWRAYPEVIRGGSFSLSGCPPGTECAVYFLDPERHLGATVRANASRTKEPLTVRLEPCGTAKARFVDGGGKPIADFQATLKMVVTPGPDPIDLAARKGGTLAADTDFVGNIDRKNYWNSPKTDDAGRVAFPILIPGADYRIVAKDFRVQAGQTLDLGDIVVDRPRGL